MPPQTLYDISGIDLNRIVHDQDEIRACNPQRGDMEMLNAIVHARPENGEIIGYKDIGDKEFWVEGHIPGRPLFPGVLMVEAGAQLASFYTRKYLQLSGFIGFGGLDNVKFRGQVLPNRRLYIIGQKLWYRHHRICCDVQGMVDGALVFEARITGVEL